MVSCVCLFLLLRFVILARIDLVSAVVGVFMLLDEVLFSFFCVLAYHP